MPSHFPSPKYDFSLNPLTQEKIQLGRALFYDPLLSADNSISCASCHSPYNSFAHTDHSLSHGIDDQMGDRNAPALFNLAWQSSFMWDGAVNHLDVQALAPIAHKKEMNQDLNELISELQESDLYPNLFQNAYSDSTVTGEHMLKALSQFQLSLISSQSKFDKIQAGNEEFTDKEKLGYELFLSHCNACHSQPTFSNYEFKNNGLPIDTTLNDLGRIEVTKKAADSLKFKTPSLRNLSYTFPYMHDGRFRTLREVLNHYDTGIVKSSTLAPELENRIPLTDRERTDLISFLLTLNDEEFIQDPQNKFPRNILLTH